MARIKCTQCGKKFSDSKDSCPRCDAPRSNKLGRKRWIVVLVVLVAVTSLGAFIASHSRSEKGAEQQTANTDHGKRLPSASTAKTEHMSPVPVPTMKDLLTSSDVLSKCDVAVMNLLCAQGLPGSANLDIQKCIRLLNDWTAHTKSETTKYLTAFYRNPKIGDNSEAKYRMLTMAAVLVEDMKCDYNMDLVTSGIMANEQSTAFFRDSRDVFIHGLLMDKRRGTCSSMPVLLTAISQRLGYPVRLATVKGHLIAIWDDGKERFNIGYAGKGITFDTDDFYRKWPKPISEAEYKSGLYLQPLSNNEVLSIFLSIRAMCSLEHRNFEEATASAQYAVVLRPKDTWMQGLLCSIQKQYHDVRAQQQQEALEQAAATLRANGQEEAARLILYGPHPHGMPIPPRPGLPQNNAAYPQTPLPPQPGLPGNPKMR
mgnify:CR=1 FL=1